MTVEEFSNAFDTLLSSYSNQAQFGEDSSKREITLDEYEKSLFLTKAQEELVISLYTGKNPYGDSFESSEEMRRYLSNLVVEKNLNPIVNADALGIVDSSNFFALPKDLWFLTYEAVTISSDDCKNGNTLRIYPIRQDEFQNIKDNPFRGANDRRALRLDLLGGNVEIVCKYTVKKYYIRYIKKLTPIILVALPDNLSIDGVSNITECSLHESLHRRILDRAVILALQSKGYNLDKQNKDN